MTSPSLSELLAQRTLWLCEVPSVTGNEERLCGALQERLSALPVSIERLGNNLVVQGPRRGRPLVALLGHLDTVPPHPEDRAPGLEGERLYGLGASDMKGGLALMWTLLERLELEALPYDLVMVFYDKEEGPYAHNGLGPVLEAFPLLREVALGFALEPSDNVVQVGAVGTLHASVRFHGKAAHSARPWQGENALHKAGALLDALHRRDPVEVQAGGFTFREVMSATIGHGGRARNVIPERFDLNLNYRFAPGRSLESAQAEVAALVGDQAELAFEDLSPSGRVVTRANPLFARFLDLTDSEVQPKQAWTDVARLTQAGIDAVNLGPGLSSQAHQRDEYISLPLLLDGYRLFERFLGAPLA